LWQGIVVFILVQHPGIAELAQVGDATRPCAFDLSPPKTGNQKRHERRDSRITASNSRSVKAPTPICLRQLHVRWCHSHCRVNAKRIYLSARARRKFFFYLFCLFPWRPGQGERASPGALLFPGSIPCLAQRRNAAPPWPGTHAGSYWAAPALQIASPGASRSLAVTHHPRLTHPLCSHLGSTRTGACAQHLGRPRLLGARTEPIGLRQKNHLPPRHHTSTAAHQRLRVPANSRRLPSGRPG